MATPGASSAKSGGGLTQRLLDGVERVGNKVPHPVLMFLYLIILVVVLSHVFYLLDVSVTEQIAEPVSISVQPDYYEDTSEPSLVIPAEEQQFEITQRTIAIRSLLTVDGIRFIFTFLNPLLGAVVGAGALSGKLSDIGLDDKMMKDVARSFKAGSSALFVIVRRATADKVLAGLKQFAGKGQVFQTSLNKDDEAALRSALEKPDSVAG